MAGISDEHDARIKATEELTMRVPLHFINEENAPGRKAGGVFSHLLNDLEIRCLPRDLPEFIAVDLGALQIGDNVHLSHLVLPAGVTMASEIVDADHDHTVAMLQMPMVVAVDEDVETTESLHPDILLLNQQPDANPVR